VKLFFRAFRRFLLSFLRVLVGFLRVLHGLPRQLVSAQVISFFVMSRGGPVGMGGEFVKFSGSYVGIARHTLSHFDFSSPALTLGL
jgi:hypothetical protein